MQYLNARYYDPELSIFLQPDWFEVTKAGVGTNRFSYSFNDPVNKFDPGGNEVYSDDKEEFDDEQVEKLKKDFDTARKKLDKRMAELNAVLKNGKIASTEAEKQAIADLARSLGMSVGDLKKKDFKKAIKNMQKVRNTIGDYGKGVKVYYRGSNAEAGVPKNYGAWAPKGHGKNPSMDIFGHYFDIKNEDTRAYMVTHEMGHNSLNYSDKVRSRVVDVYGLNGSPAGEGYQNVYGWESVDAAAKEGVYINDAFTCSVGFDHC